MYAWQKIRGREVGKSTGFLSSSFLRANPLLHTRRSLRHSQQLSPMAKRGLHLLSSPLSSGDGGGEDTHSPRPPTDPPLCALTWFSSAGGGGGGRRDPERFFGCVGGKGGEGGFGKGGRRREMSWGRGGREEAPTTNSILSPTELRTRRLWRRRLVQEEEEEGALPKETAVVAAAPPPREAMKRGGTKKGGLVARPSSSKVSLYVRGRRGRRTDGMRGRQNREKGPPLYSVFKCACVSTFFFATLAPDTEFYTKRAHLPSK